MLQRKEWLPLARKLDWSFSYTTEEGSLSGSNQRASLVAARKLAGNWGRTLQEPHTANM